MFRGGVDLRLEVFESAHLALEVVHQGHEDPIHIAPNGERAPDGTEHYLRIQLVNALWWEWGYGARLGCFGSVCARASLSDDKTRVDGAETHLRG